MIGLQAILIKAIPFGIAISLSPGAALFGIIQTSLSKGFKSGIIFALGIALSDMLFIALCLWGLSNIMDNPKARMIAAFIGGAILITYGLMTFLNKHEKVSSKQQEQVMAKDTGNDGRFHILKTISKGFFFNLINPAAWILWLSILPFSGDKIEQRFFFVLRIICTIFAIDILKSFFAGKIKNNISPTTFYIINKIIGLIFCGLGVFMIIKNFWGIQF